MPTAVYSIIAHKYQEKWYFLLQMTWDEYSQKLRYIFHRILQNYHIEGLERIWLGCEEVYSRANKRLTTDYPKEHAEFLKRSTKYKECVDKQKEEDYKIRYKAFGGNYRNFYKSMVQFSRIGTFEGVNLDETWTENNGNPNVLEDKAGFQKSLQGCRKKEIVCEDLGGWNVYFLYVVDADWVKKYGNNLCSLKFRMEHTKEGLGSEWVAQDKLSQEDLLLHDEVLTIMQEWSD